MPDKDQYITLWPDMPYGAKVKIARLPLRKHLNITKYVLENIRGQNGVKILKNASGDWVITLDYSDDSGLVKPLEAWDISFSGDIGTCVHCVDWRAGKTTDHGSLQIDLTGETTAYIAEKYNMATETSILIADADKSNVVSTSTPADDEIYSYKLLYYVSNESGKGWKVVVDYRKQITRALYG